MPGPADAFALGTGPDACLLLHGLTGSPAEMRPLGEALAKAGLRAISPLLPGHGTTPGDLEFVSRGDLLDAARGALLSLQGARHIYLCGLSAGALLAIHLAAKSWLREGLPELQAVAFLAPAIQFSGSSWAFANLVGRLPALPLLIEKGARDIRGARPDADAAYAQVPWRWGAELRALSEEALKRAHRVRAPALILQGALDRTTAPAGARKLARELASRDVELRILPLSGHVLPLDQESAEVCSSVVSFFQKHGGS